MFSYTKRVSTANFTIHELRLPGQCTDEFFVKWKRGNYSGMTECSITNQDNSIFFEKKFTCKVTMYISKKDGMIRPKFIEFKVYRISTWKGKKVYGVLNMDISNGYQKAPITQTYTLKGMHHQLSQMIISYDVSPDPVDDEKEDEEDNEATSEILAQSDDKFDRWDVSEKMFSDEEARLNALFDKTDTTASELSDFRAIPSARTLMRSQRAQQMIMPDFSSIKMRRKRQNTVPYNNNMAFNPFDPPNKEEPSKIAFIPTPKETTIEPQLLLKSIITRDWCRSPLGKDVPKPAAAIYSALLFTDILGANSQITSKAFKDFIDDFFPKYKTSGIVINATPCDRFIISLSLLALLQYIPNKDFERVSDLARRLTEHCRGLLNEIIEPILGKFDKIIRELVSSLQEQPSLISELSMLLSGANVSFLVDDPYRGFFFNFLINSLDLKILQYISSTPQICTFTAAIQWNSTNTILTEKGYNFPMFREASSVVMMSAILCSDPLISDEICPDLRKEYVLKVLTNQQPDDFCPMPNDVSVFMSQYNIANTAAVGKEPYVYNGDFTELTSLIGENSWRACKFDQLTLSSFPYLKKYFS